MAIISVVTFLPQGTTTAPHTCHQNYNCEMDFYDRSWYGQFDDEDKCFQDDRYGTDEDEKEGYCWMDHWWHGGRCMNKQSYGEPCTNEDGHKDNNLCVTNYCDENGLCQRRSGKASCDGDNINTRRIRMVAKGWSPIDNLGECEGDCDLDDDCTGNLECWQRSSAYPAIPPGCSGYPPGGALEYDFCYDPNKRPGLQYHGHPSAGCGCLAECWGECDSDTDCYGGLKCYQRNHGGPVPPGCRWGGYSMSGIIDADFCYDPTRMPSNAITEFDTEPSPFEIVLEFSSWRSVQVVCGLMVILLAACCVCIVFTGFGRCGVYGGNKKYVTVKTEDSDVELSEVEAMNK